MLLVVSSGWGARSALVSAAAPAGVVELLRLPFALRLVVALLVLLGRARPIGSFASMAGGVLSSHPS